MASDLEHALRLWCEQHWMPYFQRLGNGVAATALLQERLFNDERFVRELGGVPKKMIAPDTRPEKVQEVLKKIAPACCYLGDETMREIEMLAAESLPQDVEPGLEPQELAQLDVIAFQMWLAARGGLTH